MWFEQREYSVNICGSLQHSSYSIKHTDIQFKSSADLKDFCTFICIFFFNQLSTGTPLKYFTIIFESAGAWGFKEDFYNVFI